MNFEQKFHQLTGQKPYPWQSALYNSLLAQNVPHRMSLPTGSGKTSVVPIWLSVLWHQIENGLPLTVPRRLYFAVDRRVVVDQSEVVAKMVKENAEGTPLWRMLSERTLSDNPLIVSVLRGQRVLEYEDIVSDPSGFAVILCTPDMVFSRLLGGAYGCSPRIASREMGLVGQDAFIVLDEAHISEANIKVLDFVSKHNHTMKPFWWTAMSATLRQNADFTLSQDDFMVMSPRLNAHKSAKIVTIDDKTLVPSVLRIIEKHNHAWNRLIVYLEKPAEANRVYKALCSDYRCLLLTGTMRGYEKSKLDFTPFRQVVTDGNKHALIATSAGEVGLDVSCDFLITEVAAAERLAQRFGRCNRWSESKEAYVYILNPAKPKKADEEQSRPSAAAETLSYLKDLENDGIDVSTGNLYRHPIPAGAFSRVPATLSLNNCSLIQIANTTYPALDMSDFIRGEQAEYRVNLVIRKDAEIEKLLKVARLSPDSEAFDHLAIANNEVFKELPRQFVSKISAVDVNEFLFIASSGEVRVLSREQLPSQRLAGGTLFLPESSNAINAEGLFEPDGNGEGDVFSRVQDTVTRFIQVSEDEDEWQSLETGETIIVSSVERLRTGVQVPEGMRAKVAFNDAGLVYIKARKKFVGGRMTCKEHSSRATDYAQKLTKSLCLSTEISVAVVEAATVHDAGKEHPLWQLAFKGSTSGEPLAKNHVFHNPALLSGLRHELVSVLRNPQLSPLAKWLVVSHHGRCRPMFEETAYDPDALSDSASLNTQLPELLATLNIEHGVWGLAYLEAVIRAVDINAE
jgi:CRISPR-associated endonuclease/helicase Cas3